MRIGYDAAIGAVVAKTRDPLCQLAMDCEINRNQTTWISEPVSQSEPADFLRSPSGQWHGLVSGRTYAPLLSHDAVLSEADPSDGWMAAAFAPSVYFYELSE